MSVNHVPPVNHHPVQETTQTPPPQPTRPQPTEITATPQNPPTTPHSSTTFPNGNGGKGAVVNQHR